MTGDVREADRLRHLLIERVAEMRELPPERIPVDRPLAELGMSSLEAVTLAAELSVLTGRELPGTLLWEVPTISGLVRQLVDEPDEPNEPEAAPAATPAAARPVADEPIAVVGVGCRLPGGAHGPGPFWEMLLDGAHGIGEVPRGRWESFAGDGPGAARTLSGTNRWGGFLDDIAGFDAEFFGISPLEAATMDPQQRMLLEVAWEALEHAAIPARSLAGSATGVFVGICSSDYGYLTGSDLARVDAWTPAGAALSIAANRLSYALDLRGPSLAVDTACSSSLVAVHQACASLRTGESDTALAAGVNLLLAPTVTVSFQRAGMLSPGGRCKPFSADADGLVRGEGCGVVVLKRLSDAERDGDRVLALVRSSAVNSDGRSNGLMAPNPEAQRALLSRAYAQAGIDPLDVDHVEAHATGTPLGDPLEARSLGAVLGRGRSPGQPLLLGSAKTNVGHLEAAAGITGLIKSVLALANDLIPPSPRFRSPSPHIDFDGEGLRVTAAPEPWPRYGGRATAGVSAFGFGGTNAHVVLEEPPLRPAPPLPEGGPPGIAALSDADEERLRTTAAGLAAWLEGPAGRGVRLDDIGRTLAGRVARGGTRAAVVARDRDELLHGLRELAAGRTRASVATGRDRRLAGDPVWVFSGHGSPWPGMARRLLATEPDFATAVDELEPLLTRTCGVSLRTGLGGDIQGWEERPATAAAMLFGVQMALAALWRSYGIEPAAVIGHGTGEVAAAVVAGAIGVEYGARLVAERSRALAALPARTAAAGRPPHAEEVLREFASSLPSSERTEPCLPVYSTVLDDPRERAGFDAAYWAAGLRSNAGPARAVAAAVEDGRTVFVEFSAQPVLHSPLAEISRTAGAAEPLVVPAVRCAADDAVTFRTGLAALFAHGWPVDLRRAHPHGRVQDLPTTPWRHRRHWVDAPPAAFRSAYGSAWASGESGDAGETAGADTTVAGRLAAHVASVMGFPPDRIDRSARLTDLGLDSLMGARIRAAVEREFGLVLPAHLLLRGASVDAAAGWLSERLAGGASPAPGEPSGTSAPPGTGACAVPDASPGTPARTACAPRTVAPRDAAERIVAHAWREALAGGPVGMTDDFFRLGGDWDLAGRVTTTLSERLGTALDAKELFAVPTAEAVAAAVRPYLEGPAGDTVRPLRAEGHLPPLFLAHPAGGSSAVYRLLADRLGPGQPVLGLERLEEPADVESRAARYAALIRREHPGGPYRLGGWSVGGLLAYETARLLAAEGHDVDQVVLIDSIRPLPAPGLSPGDEARRRFTAFAEYVEEAYGRPLPLPFEELAGLGDTEQIARVVRELRAAVDPPAAVLEHQRTSYLDLRVGERYRPGPYAGHVVLYRATEPAPHTVRDARYERDDLALGWDEVCSDLDVVPVPGHHLSLLDPPHVDVIAAHMADLFQAAPSRSAN